ncbi:MAG: RadC family protein [Acutalibacteraceae bacterium]
MSQNNLHAGHRKRVKENVCKNGFSQLEEHRLLELILFYSIPREDTNVLAHKLINHFGSFENIFSADIDSLKNVEGVGENTAVLIASVGEVYKRLNSEKLHKKSNYKNTKDLKKLAYSLVANEEKEAAYIICFDGFMRLKKYSLVGGGDETTSSVDIKKVVQAVVGCDCSKAVLVHNHPVGDAKPSLADIETTRSLCVKLRSVGYCLSDHIIIGSNGGIYSMFEDPAFKILFN